MRMTPIAASSPLTTAEGKKAATKPARAIPSAILDQTGNEEREEKGLERAERNNLGRNHGCQAGGGAAHARLGSTQCSDQEPADHSGQQPRKERRAGGQRNAQAERQGDEEHDQPGSQIARPGTTNRFVRWHQWLLTRRPPGGESVRTTPAGRRSAARIQHSGPCGDGTRQ